MSRHRDRRDVVGGAWWALAFITLQAISGMTLVFTGGQLLVEIAHVTLVSTFFSILSYLCMQVGWFPKRHAVEGAVGASPLEPTNAETESALSS
jgi:cytochrome c oxidase assembly protein subunit 15